MKGLINIKNNSNKCFLNPLKTHPQWIAKVIKND